MENLRPGLTLRIGPQKGRPDLAGHRENPVVFQIALPVQGPGVPRLTVVHVDERRLFPRLHVVRHVVRGPPFQKGHGQVIPLLQPLPSVGEDPPQELIHADVPLFQHIQKIPAEIGRKPRRRPPG